MTALSIAEIEARLARIEVRLAELPAVLPIGPLRRTIDATADEFGVSSADLVGEGQTRPVVAARQAAALVMRRVAGASLPRIGRFLARYHSTISHAVGRAEARERLDPDYAARIARIATVVTGETR